MLERFLGIHPGERKSLFFFCLLGFCWSIATSSGVALSDALFLKHVGSQALAYTFALSALGLFMMSGLFMYFLNRLNINQTFQRCIYLAILFHLTMFALISFGYQSKAIWIFFKVFAYVFQIAFASCFYSYLDQFFELQNAKRVFSILYSAIFLGMAVSGAILLLSFSSFGTLGMITLILLSLVTSSFLLRYITKSVTAIEDEHQEFSVTKTSYRELFRAIVKSKFTSIFLLVNILMETLMVVTEFQYMSGLEEAFKFADPSALTTYLGKLYLWGSLFNIVFGVLLYSRLVKKIGLNNMILIVPIFLTYLFGNWMFASFLSLSIMGFMTVEGVFSLVNDNNFNLLLNAAPLKLKNKIRITCEIMLEPCGMLLSALLLAVMHTHSKALGLGIALVLLGLTFIMRAYYAKGIFYNLISHVIPFNSNRADWITRVTKQKCSKSKQHFLNQFNQQTTKEKLFLVEYALKFNDEDFLLKLLKKISQCSDQLQINVLHLIDKHALNPVGDSLEPYFNLWAKKSEQVKAHATFFKAKQNLLSIEEAKAYLQDPNPYLMGSAILTLLKKMPHTNLAIYSSDQLLKMLTSNDEQSSLIALETLKHFPILDFKREVIKHLKSSVETIKAKALIALRELMTQDDYSYTNTLIDHLREEKCADIKVLILKVIEKIASPKLIEKLLILGISFSKQEKKLLNQMIEGLGVSIISTLVKVYQNEELPDKTRLLAASSLAKVSLIDLKQAFDQTIEETIYKAHFYFYHNLTIQKSNPYTNLNLLELALKNSFRSKLKLILEPLALINHFDKGEYLYHSLVSSNPKTYSHAIESIDKMCSVKLYKKLHPIIDKGMQADFLKLYYQEDIPILSLDKLLKELEKTPSYVNQAISLNILDRLSAKEDIKLTKSLKRFTSKFLEGANQ